MERLENLTLSGMESATEATVKAGYSETQSIENIPVGVCSATTCIIGKGANKSPNFAVIKFERKDKDNNEVKLFFQAVKLDVLHVTSGKKFNGIYAKVTPELKTALSKAENYSKELIFNSEGYVDGQKRQRTILKFESMSK